MAPNICVTCVTLRPCYRVSEVYFFSPFWREPASHSAVRQMQLGRAVALHPLCFLGSKIGTHKTMKKRIFRERFMYWICAINMSDFFAGISDGVISRLFAVHIGWQSPPLSHSWGFYSVCRKTSILYAIITFGVFIMCKPHCRAICCGFGSITSGAKGLFQAFWAVFYALKNSLDILKNLW